MGKSDVLDVSFLRGYLLYAFTACLRQELTLYPSLQVSVEGWDLCLQLGGRRHWVSVSPGLWNCEGWIVTNSIPICMQACVERVRELGWICSEGILARLWLGYKGMMGVISTGKTVNVESPDGLIFHQSHMISVYCGINGVQSAWHINPMRYPTMQAMQQPLCQ